MLIEVEDSGVLREISDADFEFDENKVYLFISIYDKTCYIWLGKNASIREQFIAAKEARNIKMDTGFSTVRIQEEGAEDEFEESLDIWKNDNKKFDNPAAVIIEQRERISKMIGEDEASSVRPSKVAKAQKASVKEMPQTLDIKIASKKVPGATQIKKIIAELGKLDPIEDHELDYVVSSGYVYVVERTAKKIQLSLLDEVKDGVFQVENYLPRFIIQKSQLIAIELWRIPN